MRIVGGHIRSDGKLGAFVEEIYPRGPADQLHGEIREGKSSIYFWKKGYAHI